MKRWRRRGEFPTIVAGWRRAVAWLIKHGPVRAVGVEGTSSYGVGIITELRTAGIAVVEVNRTRAAEKRRPGKTDPLDRSVLSGEATTGPKSPTIEPLRVLRIARRSAIKAQQATRRQINAVLVNADPALHDLPDAELLAALRNRRPEQLHHSDNADTMFALRALARRHRILQEEITDLEQRLLHRSTRPTPHLRVVRRPVRHRPDPAHLRKDQPTPPLPRRGSAGQRRLAPLSSRSACPTTRAGLLQVRVGLWA